MRVFHLLPCFALMVALSGCGDASSTRNQEQEPPIAAKRADDPSKANVMFLPTETRNVASLGGRLFSAPSPAVTVPVAPADGVTAIKVEHSADATKASALSQAAAGAFGASVTQAMQIPASGQPLILNQDALPPVSYVDEPIRLQ
jgi:hypothetical protein